MSVSGDYIRQMSLQQELHSFSNPAEKPEVSPPVKSGDKAPESDQLSLPGNDARPVLITFLRHCGCPFAEKTFQTFRHLSDLLPSIRFIAVSHSTQPDTDSWLLEVGGTGDVEVLYDPHRTLYGKWGLGFSSYWANMGPVSIWKSFKLSQEEQIYNRPTKSGYRWQTAGSFAVDNQGIVRWAFTSRSSSDMPGFEEALRAIGIGEMGKGKGRGKGKPVEVEEEVAEVEPEPKSRPQVGAKTVEQRTVTIAAPEEEEEEEEEEKEEEEKEDHKDETYKIGSDSDEEEESKK